MFDFGYSKYQVGVANIYFGIGGYMSWSYAQAAGGTGVVAKYRTLMGVGM